MLPIASPSIGEEELENVISAVKSGWISSHGEYITQFEEEFSTYCGKKIGVATSNGTVSLHLALLSLDIGPGDEVILPTFTFIASANAITYTGARPVFVDSELDTYGPCPKSIEAKITPNTKAIMVVHLYGHPCNMEAIAEIAQKHGLPIIEDAAEAHGATCFNQKIGSFGRISSFSFYGNKTITTGEGGMCITDDEELAKRMRILRDHGMSLSRKYWHDVVGYNYRMTNLQAAIGVAQLKKLDGFIEKKRLIAKWYSSRLAETENVTLPRNEPWANPSYWMYGIRLKENRDELIEHLAKNKIDSRPFFSSSHQMPPYKSPVAYPVAEELSATGLLLPSGVDLNESHIEEVTEAIKKFKP